MNYPISSNTFSEPAIPELLILLSSYFSQQGIPFYVVGATARDLVLGKIHERPTGRKTNDLDIAIMVRDWATFEKVQTDLTQFIQQIMEKHRLKK